MNIVNAVKAIFCHVIECSIRVCKLYTRQEPYEIVISFNSKN